MKITESVSLASLTTLKVGGSARYVATCSSVEDIKTAIMFAHDRGLSWYVIGGGSNLLAPDAGYDGVIIRLVSDSSKESIFFEEEGEQVRVIANADVEWDSFVTTCVEEGLWGIENLAGIPGTVGASPVQNIGAYGMEVADTLEWVEVFDTETLEIRILKKDACGFGYRESMFKHTKSLIITRVAFLLSHISAPKISYVDISSRIAQGVVVNSSSEIATLVRAIRSEKFPNLKEYGTAGSFFKNPIITKELYEKIQETYPELPGYEAPEGIKVSLAWILDKVLHLKGYSEGPIRLFEKQPLVLVTEGGATGNSVDEFANKIAEKVLGATNIRIEREVQKLF